MILAPDFFYMKKAGKPKNLPKKLEEKFISYYFQIFKRLTIRKRSDAIYEKLMILLPCFSFGEECLFRIWDEFERRVELLYENKEKNQVHEAG